MEMWISRRAAALLLKLNLFVCVSILCSTASANVVLIGSNVTRSFDDIEANFAPSVKGSGYSGVLYLAEPIDACSPLTKTLNASSVGTPFVLMIRGGCTFEDKVRRAQSAGFRTAIVYDNEDSDALVAMAGTSTGIKIYAVFVSKLSGEMLKKYAGRTDVEIWIIPTFENSAWSIMAISFISLLAISAVLATCFFIRRHRIRRERPQSARIREFHGMSSRLVKAMPSLIFTTALEDNSTSRTCAICLEDYSVGEKLRILPCCHKFHAVCVDSWLTSWRTFCPVCKRDARTANGDPPASECTPLLSSAASLASFATLSSYRSSLPPSPPIQIGSASVRSSASHIPSISSSHLSLSRRSYNSPGLSINRSSMDLRQASSLRSHASPLYASYSLGYPSLSSLNARCMSPYIPSSTNASSYVGSSSQQQYLLRYSGSAASISPFASAQSLPGVEPIQ